MFILTVAVVWLTFVLVFLIVWSDIHKRARRRAGIDEALYINTEDEASLAEVG